MMDVFGDSIQYAVTMTTSLDRDATYIRAEHSKSASDATRNMFTDFLVLNSLVRTVLLNSMTCFSFL